MFLIPHSPTKFDLFNSRIVFLPSLFSSSTTFPTPILFSHPHLPSYLPSVLHSCVCIVLLCLTISLSKSRHINPSTLFLFSVTLKIVTRGGRLKMAPMDGLGSQGGLVGWLFGWLAIWLWFEGWQCVLAFFGSPGHTPVSLWFRPRFHTLFFAATNWTSG